MTDTSMCMVCIETYTKQPNRKHAKCPYCDVQACVKCTQTYLMNTTEDPHCMGCRRAWNREVMDAILLTTWLNDEYKKHRQNVLLDRERSRLPAAQVIVEFRKQAKVYIDEREKLNVRYRELQTELSKLYGEQGRLHQIIATLQQGRDPFAVRDATGKEKEERRVFVMPCPATGCRGFLSQAYKCGVCDMYTCPSCREVKGLQRDGDHTCNADTVATVERLKKECRNCPECGTNIFKIEGCDQMYCTNCNTPFSWITGKKVTQGAIHNPHYYEYVRKMNGGQMPRQAGDIPCIANLPNAWTFESQVLRRFPGSGIGQTLLTALQTITHIQHVEIPRYTNRAQDTDTTELNVRYLLNEITDVRWKQLLQQQEKKRMKKDEIRMCYEALVGACVDLYGSLTNTARVSDPKDLKKIHALIEATYNQFIKLIEIFTQGMALISRRYKCQVMILDAPSMRRKSMKFTTGTKRKVVKKKTDKESVSDVELSDSEDEAPPKNTTVQL
jgi:hypothetical protein